MAGYPRSNADPFKLWNPWWSDVLVGGRNIHRKGGRWSRRDSKDNLQEGESGPLSFVFGKDVIFVRRYVLVTQTRSPTLKHQPASHRVVCRSKEIDGPTNEEVNYYRRNRTAHRPKL